MLYFTGLNCKIFLDVYKVKLIMIRIAQRISCPSENECAFKIDNDTVTFTPEKVIFEKSTNYPDEERNDIEISINPNVLRDMSKKHAASDQKCLQQVLCYFGKQPKQLTSQNDLEKLINCQDLGENESDVLGNFLEEFYIPIMDQIETSFSFCIADNSNLINIDIAKNPSVDSSAI